MPHRLAEVLGDQFDAPLRSGAQQGGADDVAALRARIRYLERTRSEAQAKWREGVSSKEGGQLRSLWQVRAGLADPNLPARTVSQIIGGAGVSFARLLGRGDGGERGGSRRSLRT